RVHSLFLDLTVSAAHAIPLHLFFFQAEDGIRDLYVTGVQTCALPISTREARHQNAAVTLADRKTWIVVAMCRATGHSPVAGPGRSEERRVGKECRSRGSGEQ